MTTEVFEDDNRPTTVKQRYRASGKTLLRVSHLRQHDISQNLVSQILSKVKAVLPTTDILIFSDFNYGCLPQSLVDEITTICRRRKIMMVADSQSSSQTGDISRFKDMMLQRQRNARRDLQ